MSRFLLNFTLIIAGTQHWRWK